MLIEAKAILFSQGEPFTFTSGMKSPVYTDMRKIIAYPRIRTRLIDFAVETIEREIGYAALDVIAGGETAGIPFAAWNLGTASPCRMQYIRKKPKGFGRNAQIEGEVVDAARALLVEDLATDGGSKVGFIEALRKSGQRCDATFVFFFYDIFPQGARDDGGARRRLHYLVTWRDILAVAKADGYFAAEILAEVEAFSSTRRWPGPRRTAVWPKWHRRPEGHDRPAVAPVLTQRPSYRRFDAGPFRRAIA